jgi:hypothetical protein
VISLQAANIFAPLIFKIILFTHLVYLNASTFHERGQAVVNAMQFKELIGSSLSADERKVLESTKTPILRN